MHLLKPRCVTHLHCLTPGVRERKLTLRKIWLLRLAKVNMLLEKNLRSWILSPVYLFPLLRRAEHWHLLRPSLGCSRHNCLSA